MALAGIALTIELAETVLLVVALEIVSRRKG
jgi:hypothetical protein